MHAFGQQRRLFYCELARRLTFVGHPSLLQTLLLEDEVELRHDFSRLVTGGWAVTGSWAKEHEMRYSNWTTILGIYHQRFYVNFITASQPQRCYASSLFLFATLGDLEMLLWMRKLSKAKQFHIDWKTALAKFANSGNYHDLKTLLQALRTKLGPTGFSQLVYGNLPIRGNTGRATYLIKRNYSELGYHHTLKALFEIESSQEPSPKILYLLLEHVIRPELTCDEIEPLTVPQLLEAAPGELLMCHVDPFFRHAFSSVAKLPLLDLIVAEIQRRQLEPELYRPELRQMLEFGVSYCSNRDDFETVKGLSSWAKRQHVSLSFRRCVYKLFTQRGSGKARFTRLRQVLRYGRPKLEKYLPSYVRQLASMGEHEISLPDRLSFLRTLLRAADKRGLRSYNVELLRFIPDHQPQMRQLVEIYPAKLSDS